MPQLGETVAEGKITAWFKSVGDTVKAGDNLFEIETDKVSMEVPATSGGTLSEIRVVAGELAPVGTVLAVLAETGAALLPAVAPAPPGSARSAAPQGRADAAAPSIVAKARTADAGARPAPRPPHAPTPVMLDPFREVRTPARNYGPAQLLSGAVATPLARRLAGEAGIDLAVIAPSGPNGRIVGRDVENAIGRGAAGAVARPPGFRPADIESVKALYDVNGYEEIAIDTSRQANATRLVEAHGAIPQFFLSADLGVDRLLAIRDEANAAALPDIAGKPSFRWSLTDFFVKALALALQRVPAANAVWARDRILRFRRSDIGIAVTTAGGTETPVIHGAEALPLTTLAAVIRNISERACRGQLDPAETRGGASSVSELSAHNVRQFASPVCPPHSTRLAVGAPVRQPVEADNGGVRFAGQVTVTLSCDARVIEPACGAELLDALRHLIEHPLGLLL